MAIFLAALASFFIGSGEHVASAATRRTRPEQVVVGYFVSGAVIAPLTLLLVPSELGTRGLLLGALAGCMNASGLLFLYRAYSVSSVGVAAPLAGVLSAVVPVVVDIAGGDGRPSAVTTSGIVVGIAAVGFTSFSPGRGGQVAKGVRLATTSGLSYGLMLTLLGHTDEASGLWPTVPQRVVALIVVVVVAGLTGSTVLSPRGLRRPAYIAGVFGSLGVAAFTAAVQRGSLGAVSVAASQFPAVAVGLGFVLRGERVWWWQTVGLIGAVFGVALIAVG